MSQDYKREECKDEVPARTIRRIRGILAGLNIELDEQNLRSTSHTFTTKLYIRDTLIGSQGKGVSKVLSRASAYAEFIERLQNMILAAPFHTSPAVLGSGNCKFAPDEKIPGVEEYEQFEKDFGYFRSAGSCNSGRSVIDWLKAFPGTDKFGSTALPFCSLLDGKIHCVPWQLFGLYRSNGMCAGNTAEEALVQGVSEILERHVNKVAITEPLTPPDVPATYLRRFKRPITIINEIEKTGKYRVIVKDFSLGRALPVLGIILVGLENQSYMVNFGAHPRFEIALERCLTEALQSYKLDERMGKSLFPFSFYSEPVKAPYNFINSVRIGRGHFPGALFSDVPSYKFKPWRDPGRDNKVMLRRLLLIVKGLGFEVLARDKSFLGFPAFQVLSPGLSEVDEPPGAFLASSVLRSEVSEIMKDIPGSSGAQRDKVLSYITSRLPFLMECQTLSSFLDFPVKAGSALDASSVPLFLAKLFYRKGDLAAAQRVLNSIIGRPGPANVRHAHLKCVRDYLATVKGGSDKRRVRSLLRLFYPATMVENVIADWGDPVKVLRDFPVLPCMNCRICPIRRHCMKARLLTLYRKLKGRIVENPIDQEKLRRYALAA